MLHYSFIMFLILLGSSVGAYLVGRQPDVFDVDVLICTLYVATLLFVMFSSFGRYRNIEDLTEEAYIE